MNIKNLFPTVTAEAHCDVPCGIYDPTPAKIAAKTVARMIEQMEGLAQPAAGDAQANLSYLNATTRRIGVKEQHAEICKRELETLWSDFFKPEHLEQFPNLHTAFWQAVKLASKCKQEGHKEDAYALIAAVDQIAEMFYTAKKAPQKYDAYKLITDTLY